MNAILTVSPNFIGIGGKKYLGHFSSAPPISNHFLSDLTNIGLDPSTASFGVIYM